MYTYSPLLILLWTNILFNLFRKKAKYKIMTQEIANTDYEVGYDGPFTRLFSFEEIEDEQTFNSYDATGFRFEGEQGLKNKTYEEGNKAAINRSLNSLRTEYYQSLEACAKSYLEKNITNTIIVTNNNTYTGLVRDGYHHIIVSPEAFYSKQLSNKARPNLDIRISDLYNEQGMTGIAVKVEELKCVCYRPYKYKYDAESEQALMDVAFKFLGQCECQILKF